MRFAAVSVLASLLSVVAVACGDTPDPAGENGGGQTLPDGGTGGGGGSGGGDGGGGGGGACTSRDFATTALAAGEQLVDLAVGKGKSWLLAKSTTGAIAVHEVGGQRRELEASGVTGQAISPRPDGEVCVLWGTGANRATAKVKTACSPSFDVVDTGVAMTLATRYKLGFRDDGPDGAAAMFAESNALDGIARDANGEWQDASLMKSSISFGGGPRALSGAKRGSPLCYVANGGIVVERWQESGSANAIGTMAIPSRSTFYEDVGCAVAVAGTGRVEGLDEIVGVGVMGVAGGVAKLAVRPATLGGRLTETALDATDISSWSFAASTTHYVGVYATGGSLFRARVPAAGGAPDVKPVALPGGAQVTNTVAVAFDAAGAEHLAVQTAQGVAVATTCAP